MNSNKTSFARRWAARSALGIVAACALLGAGAASARGHWSVQIGTPGLAVGAYPAPYYAPYGGYGGGYGGGYAPAPVYSYPAPVYYDAPPVYYRPAPPVYYRPAPVYAPQGGRVYYGPGFPYRTPREMDEDGE